MPSSVHFMGATPESHLDPVSPQLKSSSLAKSVGQFKGLWFLAALWDPLPSYPAAPTPFPPLDQPPGLQLGVCILSCRASSAPIARAPAKFCRGGTSHSSPPQHLCWSRWAA